RCAPGEIGDALLVAIGPEAERPEPPACEETRRELDRGRGGSAAHGCLHAQAAPVARDLVDEIGFVRRMKRPLQPAPCTVGAAMSFGDVETDDAPERLVGNNRRR